MKFPQNYHEGTTSEKDYDRILFLPKVLQSQELNYLQHSVEEKIKRITKSVYKDGEVLSGQWHFDGKKLNVTSLTLIIEGFPYCIKDQSLEVREEDKFISCKLEKTIIDHTQDPSLLDPGIAH